MADWRGQIVVLNFWSAECPWSRRADVALVYRQLAWDPKGVRIVGVASNANETETQVRAEAQARHLKYALLYDFDQTVATLYQAKTTPHFFVIDRQGYVRYAGALDNVNGKGQIPSMIYLDEAVSALLANRPPNPLTTAPFGSPLVYRSAQPAETKPASVVRTPGVADTEPVQDTPLAGPPSTAKMPPGKAAP